MNIGMSLGISSVRSAGAAAPNTAPTISSSATFNVAENSTAVGTVTATDGQTPYEFSIPSGADADQFSINASTGVLAFLAAPDYEVPDDVGVNNVYNLTVRVASVGGAYAEQNIAVTVTNLADAPPTITSSGTFNVAEGSTSVGTVTATGGVTPYVFSIPSGVDAADFSINSSTGVLVFSVAPDYEAPGDDGTNNVYNITVRVTSADGAYDEENIAITVTDETELTNTAFVSSSGNDGTAALNLSGSPYATILAATNALVAAYPGEPTTVILLSNLGTTESLNKDAYNLSAGAELTLDGDSYTVADITLNVPSAATVCKLTLKDITISSSLTTPAGCSTNTSDNFGTIYHVGTVFVQALNLLRPGNVQSDSGINGTDAFNGTGTTGTNGADGSGGMPGDGSPGETVSSTGGNGTSGQPGKAGWTISLLEGTGFVAATYTYIYQGGTQGGNGGTGGGNSGATGGTGGSGGNAWDDGMGTPMNGANGGNGGDCTITGGNGGDGGHGGDGGVLTIASTITAPTPDQTGGMSGFGGNGGTVYATGGAGGSWGNGVNGGFTGNAGNSGNGYPTNGTAGNNGSSGNNGSTNVV